MMRKKLFALAALLLAGLLVLTGCGQQETALSGAPAPTEFLTVVTAEPAGAPEAEVTDPPAEEAGPITEPQAIGNCRRTSLRRKKRRTWDGTAAGIM